MTDLLKSAFSYISSAAVGTPRTNEQASYDDNSFVGQVVDISNHRLRIRKAIAEGGFGIVYIAQDIQSGKDYTIKRMFAHESDRVESVVNEINILKKLTGHVNIVEFIAAASDQQKEFLILTEFCSGGALVDHLQKQRLNSFPEVLQVFYQICQALRHLHSQRPAIIHRDMKIENLLLSDKYFIKLIDFGSATTSSYYPDSSWSGAKRSFVEDEMTRNTTPMYRPPEILDLYQNFPINEALDIWALGCILYVLCFGEHPYSDSSKLRIVNANYPTAFLNSDSTFTHFHDMIRGCFMIDPRQRPKITDILDRLAEFSEALGVPLAKPLRFFASSAPPPQLSPSGSALPRSPPVARSASPANNNSVPGNNGSAGGGLFGGQFLNQMKGQAGSLVKNLKDASSKMVDVVAGGVTKSDLDISHITSRIMVMSQPSEGVETVVYRNNIDEVRAWLDAKYYGSYAVFNLSSACKYRHAKFDNRVSEAGWSQDRVPPLAKLFTHCHQLFSWLNQNRQHVVVIHCSDGRSQSPIAVCAFLCFVGAFDDSTKAAQLFVSRRGSSQISPSLTRYCQYMCQLRSGFKPHDRPFSLSYIVLKSVPIVNRQRSGCKPYVEVYCGDQLIHTTQRDYVSLRQYTVEDKTIHFNLNVNVFGDVTIVVYHARSTITDRMQGKQLSSIKICQLQFHAGFIDEASIANPLEYDRTEIDLMDPTPGTYNSDFGVVFELRAPSSSQFSQRSVMNTKMTPWADYNFEGKVGPELAFSSPDEMYALTRGFKSGRGRRYQDEDADDDANAAGLLEDSDGSGDYSPPKQLEHRGPPRPPAPNALPPRPELPSRPAEGESRSQFYVETEKPELPSRPRGNSDFQPDFSVFTSNNEPASSQNEAPLVDIWPGDSMTAAPVSRGKGSGGGSGNGSATFFDVFSEQQPAPEPHKAPTSENPFLVDFGEESESKVQTDLFGISQQPEPESRPAPGETDLFGLFTAPAMPAATLADKETTNDNGSLLTPSIPSDNNEQQQEQQQPLDPFADLFGGGGSSDGKKKTMGQMAQNRSESQRPATVMNPNAYGPTAYGRSYSPKPTQAPNVNRSSPVTVAPNRAMMTDSPTKEQQPKNSDPFAEIFGGMSDMNSNKKPTTMGAMREELFVKDNDPEVVKVRLWAEGKIGNIRALLSTLDNVLWEEGLAKWEPVPIHQLVKSSEVKRAYKKAVVVIHPDKLVGQPNERLARLIFVELNEAWSEFERELTNA